MIEVKANINSVKLKNQIVMKTLIFNITAALLILLTACQKDESENPAPNTGVTESIIPTTFGVDVPSSLIDEGSSLKSGTVEDDNEDFSGNDIYKHLRTFIAIGHKSAQLVREILFHISYHQIQRAMSFPYESDEDGRMKNLVVTEGASYHGTNFEYKLVITDADSEENADGGRALVIFWNQKPLQAIAILKPYNINRTENPDAKDAVYRINYSEIATAKYDRQMTVTIANLPLPSADEEPFAVNMVKMFVGKKGDYVDVYGNTCHPNATLFTEKKGFNWAFVASGIENEDAGVAEVGLPPVDLNSSDRDKILVNYSIKSVITNEVNEWFMSQFNMKPNQDDLSKHLQDADAPGYFNRYGFIQAGEAPNALYSTLKERIQSLSPYNPEEIRMQEVELE